MVRIVNIEHHTPQAESLNAQAKALLQVLGVVIAKHPDAVIKLLDDYSLPVTEHTDKAVTDQLLLAIAECDRQFNQDLGRLILDCSLESDYDSFDFRSLFNKGANSTGEENSSSGTSGNSGGVIGGIANAVGSLGGTIGKVIQGRQAKEQASSQTLQNIYAYKTQLAATAQSQSKNKKTILISLFFLLGLLLIVFAYKKQSTQQPVIA